tara:strand:- start:50 stop:391 length:342 start_codon:yes stop_codon:yes gene_type:complete
MNYHLPTAKTFIFVSAILTSTVYASKENATYVCELSGNVRVISVEYVNPTSAVPCRVVYEKTNENRVEYPWSARNERGYCEEKAEFLANKISRLGWKCAATEDGPKHENLSND